jgi:hypothetical protein
MVLQILLCRIDVGSFFSWLPRVCPDCYVLDNGDSYSWLTNDIDQVVRLLFPVILVLVFLSMMITYFNGCTRARSLGIIDGEYTFVGIFKSMDLYLSSTAFKKV